MFELPPNEKVDAGFDESFAGFVVDVVVGPKLNVLFTPPDVVGSDEVGAAVDLAGVPNENDELVEEPKADVVAAGAAGVAVKEVVDLVASVCGDALNEKADDVLVPGAEALTVPNPLGRARASELLSAFVTLS